MSASVLYEVHPFGYVVEVVVGGKLAEQYEAGNNPCDSAPEASVVTGGLSESVLKEYALVTAKEFAAEYGIPESAIMAE